MYKLIYKTSNMEFLFLLNTRLFPFVFKIRFTLIEGNRFYRSGLVTMFSKVYTHLSQIYQRPLVNEFILLMKRHEMTKFLFRKSSSREFFETNFILLRSTYDLWSRLFFWNSPRWVILSSGSIKELFWSLWGFASIYIYKT